MATPQPNILIVTNMGPKPAAPFQGQFVKAQYDELAAADAKVAYHYMRWHSDSSLNKAFKYPIFLLDFIWRYLLSTKRYDIIHVHFFYPTIWLALLYRLLRYRRVKIVVTCHGNDVYHYHPPSRLYRFCTKRVDSWIFASKALQQQFFAATKHSILPAGINRRYAQASQHSLADKSIDILYIGSLDRNKGMDRLLHLLPLLPQHQFVVAGAGPMQAELEAASLQYKNLSLLGPQTPEQLMQLYQQARCFISLSRNESFGLVMAEAMACYTPVIATETDGALAQVTSGVTGFRISQQQTEQQLITAILATVQQLFSMLPEQYARMQQACRQQAEPVLLPVIIAEIQQVYQDVLYG